MHQKKKWMRPITNRKKGQYSSFVSDSSSESSINNQIKMSLQKMNTMKQSNLNPPNQNQQEQTTPKRYLRIQMQKNNSISLDESLESMEDEPGTDLNKDLIKSRMMQLQLSDGRRYAPNVNGQNGGFGSGTLPFMQDKSSRPNVFETREERRRRLIEEERYQNIRYHHIKSLKLSEIVIYRQTLYSNLL